ncbi:hypothetical protein BU23DRAFT_261862 [Bimuria novae-zelandiae CBS 107.79]|uniref:RING-type domain-containing protein n=1 Tax=Bimuria novae-zelandiae CBS 107.79 TaxID=1447943 RepID=A0A6A5UUC0_9PLEO|nr:hypothetical protein BU23DRAFT_261862 [Bimuria novae-zelandiae CBS 107.79]
MRHQQALDYVEALEKISMLDPSSSCEKCPFCWGLYDGSDAEPEDTNDLSVCKTPCNHMFHSRCLVQVLEGSSTLCPVYFRDLSTQTAAQGRSRP